MAEPRQGWPRTLYGRLVLVLVAGMLLAQLLTGTIWHDARYERVAEIPARLAAAHVAQSLRLLEAPRSPLAGADPALLSTADLTVHAVDDGGPVPLRARDRAVEHLLQAALASELGAPRELHLQHLRLYDGQGREDDKALSARHVAGQFQLRVRSSIGRWLQFDVREGQAGLQLEPGHALSDYLLRIYGLRTLLIVLLALLVVRWLTRPLTRLGAAAQALGHNLHAPPLPLEGPREVRQAAQAFNQMQQQLQQAAQAREELLAAVSHDLRSPLTRLRLRTELLADESARTRWRADLDDMQELVDSILDYSSATQLRGEREPLDIDALLRTVVDDAREAGHTVQLQGQVGAAYRGFPRSLKRALANLLDNAGRYGGGAWVKAWSDARAVHIRIVDEGPGIPAEQRARMLQPFQRLEASRSARHGGTGLGLSIAVAVVQAHGGQLLLEDGEDGRGLCVRITLPHAGR
ncbi:two-component sensor histidine kinase [Stenotrophomonas sp. ZAC14D2_NAIMI4_7]|uniref:ATP-binding protein n=1 Tax=Stenotrophomonas sp. ZAC14D2_NAIMI4_7 TaxID=2072405 RepID=UPI000D53D45D|nr:ATP-binding protein [Stenotrophomonas sp. ZAC14D2_NAIMI4_7]AWH15846.1 two-component sensor histidine kinase [Stenotrophomonas sp. ZAC14D2_NAIMI4_7]